MITPFASSALYLIGMGNHESDWPNSSSYSGYGGATDSGGECGVVTSTLFPLPTPANADRPWYIYIYIYIYI